MLSKLATVANKLDSIGLTKDADFLDFLIIRASYEGDSDWDEESESGEPYTPDRDDTEDIETALTMDPDFVDVEDPGDYPMITFSDGDKVVQLQEDFFMSDARFAPFATAWLSYCQAGSDLAAEERAEARHFMAD